MRRREEAGPQCAKRLARSLDAAVGVNGVAAVTRHVSTKIFELGDDAHEAAVREHHVGEVGVVEGDGIAVYIKYTCGRPSRKESLTWTPLPLSRRPRRCPAARMDLHAPAVEMLHDNRRLLLHVHARSEGHPCVVRILRIGDGEVVARRCR
eukprot:7322636-Prymnesium_polylepis.1